MPKVLGTIAEYNPFHNGHLYHIKKSIEETGLAERYLKKQNDVV